MIHLDIKAAESKPHVLVIDDDLDFLQILRHLIDAMGYELTTSTTAKQGIEIAKSIHPDIIFCDLALPGGMDGFEFAREARSDAELKAIPMIAISGSSDTTTQQNAIFSGFDKMFPKPVKFASIRTAIESTKHFAGV